DEPLNTLHIEIDDCCFKLLALHQPVAVDLRAIVAAVKINTSDSFELQWGRTHFNPSALVLQSPWANPNGSLTFRNPVDLNGAQRTIKVNKDHEGQNGYGQLIGVIRNTDAVNPAGITKTGPGNLILANNNNSYDGPTVVNQGVLMLGTAWNNAQGIPGGITGAGLTTGSNLELNGGNVRLAYYLTRTLGSGPGQLQLTGGASGFSHIQSDTYGRITINNDANTEIVWGSAHWQPAVLVLNEKNAIPNQVVNLRNKLDLNGADRTVACNSTLLCDAGRVDASNGFMTTTGGRLTGDIRNSGGTPAGLIKTGPGHLQLTATNSYDGGTTINQGTLEFTQIAAMPATGDVTVNDGTTLIVAVGGAGEWTTGASGNGTLGGLLAGLGGQAPGTVTYVGTTNLGLKVTGAQSYSGVISSAGNVVVQGSGSLDLTGDNTFTGDVIVDGGATLILSGDNSSATGRIRIINGYLKADAANLPAGGVIYDSAGTNPAVLVGSGASGPSIGSGNDVYWNNAGGFGATDSAYTVSPNAGAALVWNNGTTGFNGKVLQLGSPISTAPVEITNDITINGNYTIRLFDNTGSTADVSILSGNVVRDGSSSRNLTVQGSGTLSLTGSNELGAGQLNINGPVVRAVDGTGLPSGCKLYFSNGILESNGSFIRNIGTGNGEVYWNNQGGFAANGGALTVNLEGGITVNWNDGNTGFRGQNPLYLGSATADNVVTFQNDIELRNNRNINVPDNPDTMNDYAVISGVISNGDGSRNLTKDNNGTLVFTGDNSYTGITTVNGGTLIIDGDQSAATGLIDVKANGNFLGGKGTIGGSVTLENNAGLTFDITTAPGSHDKLDVLGTLTFEGASVLTITSSGGTPATGTYKLVTASATPSGTLPATVNLPTDWVATVGTSGNDLVLNVTSVPVGGPSDPYDTWATGGELFGDDANGDGVSNGLAFLLGAASPTADALGLLPTVTETSGGLVLTFSMLDAASRGTATLNVEHSSDLGIADPWTAVLVPEANDGPTDGVTFVVTENAGDASLNDVEATIGSGEASGGKLFGRLKATE
ncbi:MAG: autotransporter-associated beta strand repeat-containing protein, partial [Luteolibacter sp.]